jgi:hypothetical protein
MAESGSVAQDMRARPAERAASPPQKPEQPPPQRGRTRPGVAQQFSTRVIEAKMPGKQVVLQTENGSGRPRQGLRAMWNG